MLSSIRDDLLSGDVFRVNQGSNHLLDEIVRTYSISPEKFELTVIAFSKPLRKPKIRALEAMLYMLEVIMFLDDSNYLEVNHIHNQIEHIIFRNILSWLELTYKSFTEELFKTYYFWLRNFNPVFNSCRIMLAEFQEVNQKITTHDIFGGLKAFDKLMASIL